MRIAFPVLKNEGLHSRVYGHFGSAPGFVLLDTETMHVMDLPNRNRQHAHGACSPMKALGGAPVDVVVVGGIGSGALKGLASAGISVYQAGGATIQENVDLMNHGSLTLIGPSHTCSGHGHGCGG